MTTTPITSAGTDSTSLPASSSTNSAADPLASEDTFLKLLVAQIQNQDPSSPADPTQFVSQLTQYSELEQLIQINSGITSLTAAATAAGTDNSGSGSNTSSGTGASPFTPGNNQPNQTTQAL